MSLGPPTGPMGRDILDPSNMTICHLFLRFSKLYDIKNAKRLSYAVKADARRKIIFSENIERSRAAGNSLYPYIRLFIPEENPSWRFRLREAKLSRILVEVLGIRGTEWEKKLLAYKSPSRFRYGPVQGSHAGDFASILHDILLARRGTYGLFHPKNNNGAFSCSHTTHRSVSKCDSTSSAQSGQREPWNLKRLIRWLDDLAKISELSILGDTVSGANEYSTVSEQPNSERAHAADSNPDSLLGIRVSSVEEVAVDDDKTPVQRQVELFSEMINWCSDTDIVWIVRIVLGTLKMGISEETIFKLYHPDAQNAYNAQQDLEALFANPILRDVNSRLEYGIKLGTPFSPTKCKPFPFHSQQAETLRRWGCFVLEKKMDGERMLLHFSRHTPVFGQLASQCSASPDPISSQASPSPSARTTGEDPSEPHSHQGRSSGSGSGPGSGSGSVSGGPSQSARGDNPSLVDLSQHEEEPMEVDNASQAAVTAITGVSGMLGGDSTRYRTIQSGMSYLQRSRSLSQAWHRSQSRSRSRSRSRSVHRFGASALDSFNVHNDADMDLDLDIDFGELDSADILFFSRSAISHPMYAEVLREDLVHSILADEVILDGELVRVNPDTGAVLPFGKNRFVELDYAEEGHHEGGDAEGNTALGEDIPTVYANSRLCYMVFDVLWVKGSPYYSAVPDLTELTLLERKEALNKIIRPNNGGVRVLPVQLISEPNVQTRAQIIAQALSDAVKDGDEGIVIKHSNSKYQLAVRSTEWLKIKPDYGEGCNATVDCVVLGGFYGTGTSWRTANDQLSASFGSVPRIDHSSASNSASAEASANGVDSDEIGAMSVSSFLVALAVPSERESRTEFCVPALWVPLCRVGTGYDRDELSKVQKHLAPHWERVRKEGRNAHFPDWWHRAMARPWKPQAPDTPDVVIHPSKSLLVSLKGSELTHSTAYPARVAGAFVSVRFPRVHEFRWDLGVWDADAEAVLAEYWEQPGHRMTRFNAELPVVDTKLVRRRKRQAAKTAAVTRLMRVLYGDRLLGASAGDDSGTAVGADANVALDFREIRMDPPPVLHDLFRGCHVCIFPGSDAEYAQSLRMYFLEKEMRDQILADHPHLEKQVHPGVLVLSNLLQQQFRRRVRGILGASTGGRGAASHLVSVSSSASTDTPYTLGPAPIDISSYGDMEWELRSSQALAFGRGKTMPTRLNRSYDAQFSTLDRFAKEWQELHARIFSSKCNSSKKEPTSVVGGADSMPLQSAVSPPPPRFLPSANSREMHYRWVQNIVNPWYNVSKVDKLTRKFASRTAMTQVVRVLNGVPKLLPYAGITTTSLPESLSDVEALEQQADSTVGAAPGAVKRKRASATAGNDAVASQTKPRGRARGSDNAEARKAGSEAMAIDATEPRRGGETGVASTKPAETREKPKAKARTRRIRSRVFYMSDEDEEEKEEGNEEGTPPETLKYDPTEENTAASTLRREAIPSAAVVTIDLVDTDNSMGSGDEDLIAFPQDPSATKVPLDHLSQLQEIQILLGESQSKRPESTAFLRQHARLSLDQIDSALGNITAASAQLSFRNIHTPSSSVPTAPFTSAAPSKDKKPIDLYQADEKVLLKRKEIFSQLQTVEPEVLRRTAFLVAPELTIRTAAYETADWDIFTPSWLVETFHRKQFPLPTGRHYFHMSALTRGQFAEHMDEWNDEYASPLVSIREVRSLLTKISESSNRYMQMRSAQDDHANATFREKAVHEGLDDASMGDLRQDPVQQQTSSSTDLLKRAIQLRTWWQKSVESSDIPQLLTVEQAAPLFSRTLNASNAYDDFQFWKQNSTMVGFFDFELSLWIYSICSKPMEKEEWETISSDLKRVIDDPTFIPTNISNRQKSSAEVILSLKAKQASLLFRAHGGIVSEDKSLCNIVFVPKIDNTMPSDCNTNEHSLNWKELFPKLHSPSCKIVYDTWIHDCIHSWSLLPFSAYSI